jgi:hypothetical protein
MFVGVELSFDFYLGCKSPEDESSRGGLSARHSGFVHEYGSANRCWLMEVESQAARHSGFVHEYGSGDQCWSVMTKASKPAEVQVIQPHSPSKNLQLWAKDTTWMKVTCRLLNF